MVSPNVEMTSPSEFQTVFDEATTSSVALIQSISTRPDFWLEQLKALQHSYNELVATNMSQTSAISSLTERVN